MASSTSVFDMFKVGIGPSSSHTIGPMRAARRFTSDLPEGTARLRCGLFGSLAATGVGHGTDDAVILGLAGFRPDEFDAEAARLRLAEIDGEGMIGDLVFRRPDDLIFHMEDDLPLHPNGMLFEAFAEDGAVLVSQVLYSVGGGHIATPEALESGEAAASAVAPHPYHFVSSEQLLNRCAETGQTIAEVMRANEEAWRSPDEVAAGMARLWAVMAACIDRGLAADGVLPGGLSYPRKAGKLWARAQQRATRAGAHLVSDQIGVYALAVNEENAAGGQVVTAPTNGAAGVVPAVIRYYLDHVDGADPARVGEFLLTAAAIGGIIKDSASISGAEVGCQGEVGSAAAMAAAGFCAVLDGTPQQVENAAEIALEHHLGMTCDPIRGLVQAPCIERNAMGAVKAVSAASLALNGDGTHLVSLDACIRSMHQIGRDMNAKYRETSRGGLAINVPEC